MNANFPVLLLLAITGCGSSPKTQFYTLDAVPTAGSVTYRPVATRMEVGHVDLPATLDRQSMVRQGRGSHLVISDRDRWAAPLDDLTRRALTEDLRSRFPPGTVLAPGDPSPPGTWTVTLNVAQFMPDASGRVTLTADWSLAGPGKSAVPRHEAMQVAMHGQDGQAMADAMSRALAELADRIASAS